MWIKGSIVLAIARGAGELGLSYVLDWCADDQPFALNVPGMISVPYAIELNDIMLFVAKSLTGEDFYRAVATSSISSMRTAPGRAA